MGWVLFIGLSGLAVWAFIEAVNAEPAVVGSIATAVVGVAGVLWQQHRAERERLREARRARMTPIYDDLLGFVLSGSGTGDGEGPGEDLQSFMKDLKGRQLLLGASSELIQAFNTWQADTAAAESSGGVLDAVAAYEALLRAIRKDLGHNDSDLPRWDLLRVFISDLDEHLPKDAAVAVAA